MPLVTGSAAYKDTPAGPGVIVFTVPETAGADGPHPHLPRERFAADPRAVIDGLSPRAEDIREKLRDLQNHWLFALVLRFPDPMKSFSARNQALFRSGSFLRVSVPAAGGGDFI